MNNTVTSASAPKAGMCPHGMPPSACPICSQMGGGSRKKQINFKSSPPQMMTWNQCEAIGFFLKGQRRGIERRKLEFKLLTQALANLAEKVARFTVRLEQLAQMFSQNIAGFIVSVPIKSIMIPAMNLVQGAMLKVIDISDKIAAIFGEIKKGLEKAFENLKKFAKEIKDKFFKLFEVFGANKSDENEKQIDEEKRIFHFNNLLKLIRGRRSKDKDEA